MAIDSVFRKQLKRRYMIEECNSKISFEEHAFNLRWLYYKTLWLNYRWFFSELIHYCMLCVTGLYVRDIANTYSRVSHLNVSRMSDCSSCSFTDAEVMTVQWVMRSGEDVCCVPLPLFYVYILCCVFQSVLQSNLWCLFMLLSCMFNMSRIANCYS